MTEQRHQIPMRPQDPSDADIPKDGRPIIPMRPRSFEVLSEAETGIAELLDARLPEVLEARIGPEYILGTNQTGCHSKADVEELMREYHGIGFANYNLSHRLMFFDENTVTHRPDYVESAVKDGYFGKSGGYRFVVVVPGKTEEGNSVTHAPDMLHLEGKLPEDFVIYPEVHGSEQQTVSAKYIAGYIDMEQRFHLNSNFMVSAEPVFG